MQGQNLPLLPFEENPNVTPTYQEVIGLYKSLASHSQNIEMTAYGMTDSGFPLHQVVISAKQQFDPSNTDQVLLINNAIHPGEPCGVDASLLLVKQIVSGSITVPEELTIVIIPFYNIGGGLNRGSHSRANQHGPQEYGFRGNAKNLDLNRDFVKCDSENALTFNQLFNTWHPDVFIDNHTSNGADYQYTMTLIATQKDKLTPNLSQFLTSEMLPFLYSEMEKTGYEMTPYVYARDIPDNGIRGFLDLPRYSTGYTALHNTLGFMPETHMLKSYEDRVKSTLAFMKTVIAFMEDTGSTLRKTRMQAFAHDQQEAQCAIQWELDTQEKTSIEFKGYEASYKPSDVSGQERLYYDRSKPFKKAIPYYNTYTASKLIDIPKAYIIPQAYRKVIERLQNNGVKMTRLERDSMLAVKQYYIDSYETVSSPYEGHYLHYDVQINPVTRKWLYRKGDYLVDTKQPKVKYLVNVLEPEAPDSFFAWNFFDGILMQKEYFSPYIFEETANSILTENTALKNELDVKKSNDPEFEKDGQAQLQFIYEHSHHYELTHNLYPIGLILDDK